MIVAAHQPTFLPWLGWWDKLGRADRLVLLDEVQFPKKGGTWMNRVRLLVNGEPAWVTMPIDRSYHGVRSVREVRIADGNPWRKKLEATIATSYAGAAEFDAVFPFVQELLRLPLAGVGEFNTTAIRRLAGELDLDTEKLVFQSELRANGKGTELLIDLCRVLGATTYMTGDGSAAYLEPEKF